MDVAYAFLNHHHSIWINGEQFCIWHSYFTDNMQNIFTYTHIDCLIYRKGEKNDAKNAPFTWTRTEPKAENLVQLIESKVSFVVPFNSDCELQLCRARFSQESLGMFSKVRGIPPRISLEAISVYSDKGVNNNNILRSTLINVSSSPKEYNIRRACCNQYIKTQKTYWTKV